MNKILLLGIALTFSFATFAQTMHLYGGKDHDVYLGCLNCSSYNSDSIWNEYGTTEVVTIPNPFGMNMELMEANIILYLHGINIQMTHQL